MVKIMIDGGHDENTAGKGVPTMKEFDFNRATSKYIAELLKNYENVESVFSHNLDDGIDQSLESRTDLANKLKVDAFVSVHADAFTGKSAKGETVFIYTKTGTSTLNLANSINDRLKADQNISNRGVKRIDFHVLRETKMDAVLIEFGFMTNEQDLTLLRSDSYRRKAAQMVVDGLADHYKLKKKMKVVKPPSQSNVYYRVVTGSFQSRENAVDQMEKLMVRGFESFIDIYKK